MLAVPRVWRNLTVGDRYSKPTTHSCTDIDKIPATCGDSLLSSQAIADSSKPAQLP